LSDAEIAEPGPFFRDGDALSGAQEAESLWIDLGDEQRRPVPENVVVVSAATGVDQVQIAAANEPMLLRVVVADFCVVFPAPWLGRGIVQAVFAAGDVAFAVVAQGQKETPGIGGDRWFDKAAAAREAERLAGFLEG